MVRGGQGDVGSGGNGEEGNGDNGFLGEEGEKGGEGGGNGLLELGKMEKEMGMMESERGKSWWSKMVAKESTALLGVAVACCWLEMKEGKKNERERRRKGVVYIKGFGDITSLPSTNETCKRPASNEMKIRVWQLPRRGDETRVQGKTRMSR